MKPHSRFYKCSLMTKDEVDFKIHVHCRIWSPWAIGCVFLVGPEDQVALVPKNLWTDEDIFSATTWIEVMAKLRAET